MTLEFRQHKSDKNYSRFPVPLNKVGWGVSFPEYAPVDLYSNRHMKNTKDPIMPDPKIFVPNNPHRYADMFDVEGNFLGKNLSENESKYYHEYRKLKDRLYRLAKIYDFEFDERGRPLNPTGRTGIEGLGLLWEWGPIFVAEAILVNEQIQTDGTKKYFLRVVRKHGETEWKFPAGARHRDENEIDEHARVAASRELIEEAGNDIDFSDAKIVFDDVTESSRNTDNSWMVSIACYKKIITNEGEEILEVVGSDEGEGKEINEKAWLLITEENMKTLSKNHRKMMKKVFEDIGKPELIGVQSSTSGFLKMKQ